jgi:hypothetical protein
VFVTAQGSPRTRFRRAVERRSIINAELAAREMGSLSLEDALALVVLYASAALLVIGLIHLAFYSWPSRR